ncbi:MAG: hypothetical protein HY591_00580, partial [Candidatus Omnitrophica bacterium]|nr:hypothetical protein [Candidatus Omnitrophota bacterium]
LCFAALSLSVNPLEGGNSLRFERTIQGLRNKKEVRVRVASSDGKRYQVFQRVPEPISNEKGESLDLQAIETETLAGANSSGTLYMQNTDHLSFSEQLIYTSAEGGQSDSFIVGYTVRPGLVNSDGNFRGRLEFTTRAAEEASGDRAVIDIFLENPSHWNISIEGGRNHKRVLIDASDTSPRTADFVKISFSGNLAGEARIYQEVESLPQNEMGRELDADALRMDMAGDTEGLRVRGPVPLEQTRTLVYSSRKSEDSFVVYYLADPEKIGQQDAGFYSGKIKHIVETAQGRQEFPIDLQCRIQPVFSMDVSAPPEGLSFSHVFAANPPQEKEVLVTVRSNLHKPYQVMQNIQASMANEQGKEFDKRYFSFKVDVPAGQKGRTKFNGFSPVETGEYPVLSSDAQGSPATFKVVYRLQGYPQMNSGNFSVPVQFSLNQD